MLIWSEATSSVNQFIVSHALKGQRLQPWVIKVVSYHPVGVKEYKLSPGIPACQKTKLMMYIATKVASDFKSAVRE
jgi:hypothetical protein